MTSSRKQILDAVAQQAVRLKARLAETHAAIRRAREDGAEAREDAPDTERNEEGEDVGGSNVLPFVRR
jgi:hypothetical protein